VCSFERALNVVRTDSPKQRREREREIGDRTSIDGRGEVIHKERERERERGNERKQRPNNVDRLQVMRRVA